MCYTRPAEKVAMAKLAAQVAEHIGNPFTVSDLLRTLSLSANVQTVLDARQKLHGMEIKADMRQDL